MMGRLKSDQGQLFYEFHLSDAVPEDHLVRKIDAALDLSWLRSELTPHYSSMGRPSIDPELMIRMLVVGYVFARLPRATSGFMRSSTTATASRFTSAAVRRKCTPVTGWTGLNASR